MQKARFRALVVSAVVLMAYSVFAVHNLAAQDLQILGGGTGNLSGLVSEEPAVEARLVGASMRPGGEITLFVTVKLPPGYYTYPQKPSFGKPTRIKISKAVGLTPLGESFQADRKPKIVQDEFVGEVKKFVGQVTWSRKFQIDRDADVESISIAGALDYQVCDHKSCRVMKSPFETVLATNIGTERAVTIAADPEKIHPFSHEEHPEVFGKPGPAALRIELSPKDAKPGEMVTLKIRMTLKENWHTYSITQKSVVGTMPTTIQLTAGNGLTPIGNDFSASAAPEPLELENAGKTHILETHHGEIVWSRRFQVSESATGNGYGIEGRIKYLTCSDKKCLRPQTIAFSLGNLNNASELPPAMAISEIDLTGDELVVSNPVEAGGLPLYLLYAFLGGLILNVMPCVLPVLAIKVMSFVQQAGESRSRILLLNAAYAAGVIGVFLVLATLSVVMGMGWGGLFQSAQFNLIMACVVFAMGLSLLGVFELPVPGLVGSAAGSHQKEGPSGAFLTGIFATLLATPCAGPFMGPTLAWSVRQTPTVTYLVWSMMGLGMASPYLVFGLFPGAIKWLPKPGTWMLRFKEFAGFILMGTVIFFMTFLKQEFVVPLLVMLLGISLGLWMIGNLYDLNSHIKHKTSVRVWAILLAGGICSFGYSMTQSQHAENELPWQPFSEARLNDLRAENKTILIDFTADWCLVCKTNEKIAFNTQGTLDFVEQHGIVPLVADYTDESPEIKHWLKKFNSISVPLTVIFPAGRPNEPILMPGPFTQSQLLEKLQQAVNQTATAEADPNRSVTTVE